MRIPVIVASGPRSSKAVQREILPGEEEMNNNSANYNSLNNSSEQRQRVDDLCSRLAADKPARLRYYQERKAERARKTANAANINGNNDLEKSLKSYEPILTRKSVRRPGQPSFKVGGILHGQVKKVRWKWNSVELYCLLSQKGCQKFTTRFREVYDDSRMAYTTL
jgi:hypothetical protein